MGCVHLTHGTNQWWALANLEMKFCVPRKARVSWTTLSAEERIFREVVSLARVSNSQSFEHPVLMLFAVPCMRNRALCTVLHHVCS